MRRAEIRTMQISLQSRPRKFVFLTLVFAATLAYVMAALQPWAAAMFASSADIRGLERASALQPGDAQYQYLQGRYYFYAEKDPERAAAYYRNALLLNPGNSTYLMEQANLYQFNGDTAAQREVLKRAVAAAPYDPNLRWNAGLFCLLDGDVDEALRDFRIVAANSDAAQSRAAYELAWRATHDAGRMLDLMVPPTAASHASFADVLIQNKQTDAAEQVWTHWSALPEQFDPKLAFRLIDFFIAQQRGASAAAVWRRVVQGDPELQHETRTDNLVTNGGFEDEILNGGMDWRYASNALAELEIDTAQFHGANRSMKIAFTGEEGTEIGIMQYVPVEPNTTYTFTGYVKADDIYTAHGPQFAVYELGGETPLLLTDEIVGTASWTERQGSFRTGPDASLVWLKITRGAGHIRGTLWIDDISIVREAGTDRSPDQARGEP